MITQAYLMTGEPGVGKTTALIKVIEGLGREHHFDVGALSLATGVPEPMIRAMLRYPSCSVFFV